MPGTGPCALLTHLIPTTLGGGATIIRILQMRKLGYREVK